MDVKNIQFKMSHGCFVNEITDKYPEMQIRGSIVGRWAEGPVVKLVMEGDTNPELFLDKVKNYKSVRSPGFVDSEKKTIVAKLENDDYVSHLIQDYGFSMCKETTMEKGIEYWDVVCLDNMKEFYSRLKEIGDVKILKAQSIDLVGISTEQKILEGITEKQMESIRAAEKAGYYDHPRETNIEKVAKKVGRSRSALQEQIQRAESKIIKNLLNSN